LNNDHDKALIENVKAKYTIIQQKKMENTTSDTSAGHDGLSAHIPKAPKKRRQKSRQTRILVLKYFLSLAAFFAALVIGGLIVWSILRRITWQPGDPVYILLYLVREYLPLVAGFCCLAGWTVITYFFISRPLRYLDDVVAASEKLTSPDSEPIVLPDSMKDVQDQMNLFREQAFRNATLARESEQRKNDLIVYLAHDLKTPLTSIIGYLTLLRDEPQISTELRARYTNIALEKAERLEDLINEFFDITRFNLTALTLEPERTNLSRMLEQITYEFNPVLDDKALSWQLDIEPHVEIVCDRNKLERVIDNLIRNAINYSYPDTAVTLSMKRLENQVQLCVKNCGRTIPPEKLDRIFEQFFRLDASRASSSGGAGLGLAIAREIVELHGGTIRAESASESITFTVLLPLTCQ